MGEPEALPSKQRNEIGQHTHEIACTMLSIASTAPALSRLCFTEE